MQTPLPILGLVLAVFLQPAICGAETRAGSPSLAEGRVARRAALVRELLAEGATAEAAAEAAALVAESPSATNALAASAAELAPAEAAAPRPPRGPGAWLAAGVVGFYRLFIGSAIGNRCVLEPSCSRYFLEASRRHGLLGVPMVADRFVREPAASHSERRVRMPDGSWRHPDPVSDHDAWFAKEAK